MSFIGIEFNDAAITGVADGRIVFSEAGCASLDNAELVFGAAAQRLARKSPREFFNRYWRDLSERPAPTGATGLATFADLAHAQLEHLWSDDCNDVEGAAIAVPSYWSRDQIALLLGICEEVNIPVTGIVEIPVAATRRSYPDRELVHIETYAHATTLSPVEQADGPSVATSELVNTVGIDSLQRCCAEFFARCFLECSRFDPLHDAESEQRLYDRIGDWLAQLKSAADSELAFSHGNSEFTAQVSAEELAANLRQHCQPLAQALRPHLQHDRQTVLQINPRLLNYPGLADLFNELPGCTSFMLESCAAARGLAARHNYIGRQETGIAICATLPWDQAPAEVTSGQATVTNNAGIPSHLVVGSTAYRLGAKPLRVGTESLDGDYGLTIDHRHDGVSRRHCGIEIDDGCAILSDYSRYGTLLNGHKIDGSVVLQAGDVVTIGDPPCELKLISETGPNGT